jgi:hypothetical protein
MHQKVIRAYLEHLEKENNSHVSHWLFLQRNRQCAEKEKKKEKVMRIWLLNKLDGESKGLKFIINSEFSYVT